MGDIPVSKGRVLGGITRAHVASKAKWRLRAETLQARVTELETATTAREAHMQKEIARALMRERERERELWQRDRKACATTTDRKKTQLQGELAILHGHTMVLIGELQVARGHILPSPSPHIPSRGPIIPLYELGYMPIPLDPVGSWGPYAQTQGPSQDPGYTPGALGGADFSTSPFTGNNDNDDNYDDVDQFISDSFRDDDSQQGQLPIVA